MAATQGKRADAVRNRERVLAAATALLAERGLDATVPEIAAAAGVGKATVYRSFPTKEHLVAAVACEHLHRTAVAYDEAAASADPEAALRELLTELFRRQAHDRLMASAMYSAMHLPELVEAREATLAALDRLVVAARAGGRLRPDLRGDDVRVLFSGVSRVLVERDEQDPAVWERHAELLLAALRR